MRSPSLAAKSKYNTHDHIHSTNHYLLTQVRISPLQLDYNLFANSCIVTARYVLLSRERTQKPLTVSVNNQRISDHMSNEAGRLCPTYTVCFQLDLMLWPTKISWKSSCSSSLGQVLPMWCTTGIVYLNALRGNMQIRAFKIKA